MHRVFIMSKSGDIMIHVGELTDESHRFQLV